MIGMDMWLLGRNMKQLSLLTFPRYSRYTQLKLTMVDRIRVMKTSSKKLLVATLCAVLTFTNKAKCNGQIILSTSNSPTGLSSESSAAVPSKSPLSYYNSIPPSYNPSLTNNASQVEFTSHDEWLDAVGGQDSLICIDFNDYFLGTNITTQYANSFGVTFTNGRYQVSRFSRFMDDGYGLFSFQGETHIQLYVESSAIGVNLYQKHLRIRLFDDNGTQVYESPEFDGPQSFIGVLPGLTFSKVTLDCWNSCANKLAGCCRYFNMDRICLQYEYWSAMPSVSPTTIAPSMSASPSTTTKSPSQMPSAAPSMSPSLAPPSTSATSTPIVTTDSIITPDNSSSATRNRVQNVLGLFTFWFLTFIYRRYP
jgi:hypothetical protein